MSFYNETCENIDTHNINWKPIASYPRGAQTRISVQYLDSNGAAPVSAAFDIWFFRIGNGVTMVVPARNATALSDAGSYFYVGTAAPIVPTGYKPNPLDNGTNVFVSTIASTGPTQQNATFTMANDGHCNITSLTQTGVTPGFNDTASTWVISGYSLSWLTTDAMP